MNDALFAATSNNITFSGNASLAAYQQALSSVVYFNGATEPSVDLVRMVLFQAFDGTFPSNVQTGFINVTLVDDNPLSLDCGAGVFGFTEGSGSPVSLAALLALSDLDADHEVSAASVVIGNAQLGDAIAVDAGLVPSSISMGPGGDGTRIQLVGITTAMQYQVRSLLARYVVCIANFISAFPQDVLRTLTFVNRASEPAIVQRSITLVINSSSSSDSQSCSLLVSVLLINDNAPVVDLNGPLQPFLNHTIALNYNFVSQASEWVAARDATISDLDTDGRIETLQVELTPGFPDDGVFLSASVGCPIDNSDTCHLRSAQ